MPGWRRFPQVENYDAEQKTKRQKRTTLNGKDLLWQGG
jgi:hypothetical protein